MFNKNIGAELGVNYLIGGEIISNSDTSKTTSPFLNGNSSNENKASAKMLQFRPSIIVSAGMQTINPYAKFGLLIGSGSITSNSDRVSTSTTSFGGTNNVTNTTKDSSFKFDGGFAFGFQAALGLSYNVDKNISISGELNIVNMSYAPTKRTLTSLNENGVDVLQSRPISEKEVEFVDSINVNSTDAPALPTNPRKELKQYATFGSFGLNFGVKYSL